MKIINDDINILESIIKRNRPIRIISLIIGCFIVAFFYNSFVVPNNIVYGGVGGLAIIVKKLFGISTTIFINVVTIVLIIISFIILGAKKTSYSIVGFVVYDIMINLTTPLSKLINYQFDSYLFAIVIFASLMGLGYGIIYKTGFNTGGSDILLSILQHFLKLPNSSISNVMNIIVILIGATTFGLINSIYAIIFLKICNFISDRVLIGISTSKICFITTNKKVLIEEYLEKELELGYTLLKYTNGIGILQKSIIMCVVPNDRFYELKHHILSIDKKANLISSDAYSVVGGHTNRLLKI